MINTIKKTVVVAIGFVLTCILLHDMDTEKKIECKFIENEKYDLMVQVICDEDIENIYLTDTGGNGAVFFLPSYVKDYVLDMSDFHGDFFDENGEWSESEEYEWNENRPCTVISSIGEVHEIRFIKSGNLPTIFLNTQSGSIDYLHQDKTLEESGRISIINTEGKYEKKEEKLLRVSGRGNTTFKTMQPGLSFTMETGDSLCGMNYGKKWNLVSLYYSPDLMKTKLVYDMAIEIGMEFQSNSTWVDLYCNGIYMGVYLLVEPVEVSMTRINIHDLEADNKRKNSGMETKRVGRVEREKLAYYDIASPDDISGGYIIELTPEGREQVEECYFRLDNSPYLFTIKSPSKASFEEVEYIRNYIQMIDEQIVNEDKEYWKYIDMNSFAQQFLIDLIACEQDAMWDSNFYYKDAGTNVLKAGPLWDYDRSFGVTQDHIDYNLPIEECMGHMESWYRSFYADEEFRELLIDYYIKLFPHIKELIYHRIDEYVEELSDAQKATELLLEENEGNYHAYSYEEYDNIVRYLKYNMVNRCNFLSREWGLDDSYILELPENYDDFHVVKFYDEDRNVIYEVSVRDGECISNLPEYDETIYQGWRLKSPWLIYNDKLPIYEDTKMYLERK